MGRMTRCHVALTFAYRWSSCALLIGLGVAKCAQTDDTENHVLGSLKHSSSMNSTLSSSVDADDMVVHIVSIGREGSCFVGGILSRGKGAGSYLYEPFNG